MRGKTNRSTMFCYFVSLKLKNEVQSLILINVCGFCLFYTAILMCENGQLPRFFKLMQYQAALRFNSRFACLIMCYFEKFMFVFFYFAY